LFVVVSGAVISGDQHEMVAQPSTDLRQAQTARPIDTATHTTDAAMHNIETGRHAIETARHTTESAKQTTETGRHVVETGGPSDEMRVARVMEDTRPVTGPVLDEAVVGRAHEIQCQRDEPRGTTLVGDNFDIYVDGRELKREPAAMFPAVPVATVTVPASASVQPQQSVAVQPLPAAIASSTELPAVMDEVVMSYMYDDCCPTMHCVTAAELPCDVTFILLYVDADDVGFFWAALLHDNMVRCRRLYPPSLRLNYDYISASDC